GAHQGRQSRAGSRGARAAAADRELARRPQAGLRLVPRAAGERDGLAAHRVRRAPRRIARMTFALALEIVLAAVVVIVAVWAIAARGTLPAVPGYVAYGMLLPLVWGGLGGPRARLPWG